MAVSQIHGSTFSNSSITSWAYTVLIIETCFSHEFKNRQTDMILFQKLLQWSPINSKSFPKLVTVLIMHTPYSGIFQKAHSVLAFTFSWNHFFIVCFKYFLDFT